MFFLSLNAKFLTDTSGTHSLLGVELKKSLIAVGAVIALSLSGCASNVAGGSGQLSEAEQAVVVGCTTLSSDALLNWKSAGEPTDSASLQELSDAATQTISVLAPFDPSSSDVKGMKELNTIANKLYAWLSIIDGKAGATTQTDLEGYVQDAKSLCVDLLTN